VANRTFLVNLFLTKENKKQGGSVMDNYISNSSIRHHLNYVRNHVFTNDNLFELFFSKDELKEQISATYTIVRKRIFCPMVVLRLFLMQIFSTDNSCRKTLASLIAKRMKENKKTCSYLTGAYCQARIKLPLKLIKSLTMILATKNEKNIKRDWLWKNRHVKLVDGTTLAAPDTVENQRKFPQNIRQKMGLGFPILRVVGIFSLATGSLLNLKIGAYSGKGNGETSLLKKIIDTFNPGDVALFDRYYSSAQIIGHLIEKKIDFVGRSFGAKKIDFRTGKKLDTKDHIVTYRVEELIYKVREVMIEVKQKGFRPKSMTLVTSFLNNKIITKEDLAELYLQRWNIELNFRALKVDLGMDVLKCKTPEMLKKEIWMHMLGYNIIRSLMCKSAKSCKLIPRKISFKATLQLTIEICAFCSKHFKKNIIKKIIKLIAENIVGKRPGRYEPRAVKNRNKPDRYLTIPRNFARKYHWYRNRVKQRGFKCQAA
jgi:hypothetical protein